MSAAAQIIDSEGNIPGGPDGTRRIGGAEPSAEPAKLASPPEDAALAEAEERIGRLLPADFVSSTRLATAASGRAMACSRSPSRSRMSKKGKIGTNLLSLRPTASAP